MSDTTQPPADDAQNVPPAMPLTINVQYIKDLSFEVPAGAEIFATLRANPQIAVNIDVQANRLQAEHPVFEVVLAIKTEALEAPEKEGAAPGRPVFIAELAYGAVVTLTNAPDELVEPILLVEVPRLIFPYVRNIISEVTRDGGFPPVVLQPIDFVALWQAKRSFPQTAGNA
ncbi:protein export chaperone SecB [Gluconacetobacter diazotrophicus PA1 5]|uniref:Protein-export protein SecB n=2 Tax=Gluconacetobacter diazotrophicus TaxID=33996 RepID=SECB_GLUDA|nr:protein-export chaperone SecB [Gluconacetobacter diazotrophicus]A9HK92.1 RecName: Full=Protein-export protein SecB [Gluconacetobacter diazotrophicus PA1 5]ACI50086.1 protein export chaperone SecB [Gluconacetobacter diazotrophicus PA1 5]MBB2156220.1 protein-export chaperone SecB [Gluconacetobacter diazotrophicus]TWB07834.1 preprotein translocase subunit SecB [Gluconacetobacter diazotrophicus]CAP56011.1 Protein-export protein secB [Gluconacetobacter diazotrophicus PA1 5]